MTLRRQGSEAACSLIGDPLQKRPPVHLVFLCIFAVPADISYSHETSDKKDLRTDMVMNAFNPSSCEAEAGGSQPVQGQPGLHW